MLRSSTNTWTAPPNVRHSHNLKKWPRCQVTKRLPYFLPPPGPILTLCALLQLDSLVQSWQVANNTYIKNGLPWLLLALLCQERTPLFFWRRFPGVLAMLLRVKSKLSQPYLHEAPLLYDKTFIRMLISSNFAQKHTTGYVVLCYNVLALTKSSASVGSALQSSWRKYCKRKPGESKKDGSQFLTWALFATGRKLSKLDGGSKK